MIWHGGMTCFFIFFYFLRIWLNFLKIKIWGIICQEILLIYFFFLQTVLYKKKKPKVEQKLFLRPSPERKIINQISHWQTKL